MSIMSDKAVSTEDLCGVEKPEQRAIGVARLEAILHTLVENKVESLKTESRRTQSLQSSPRKILNRLRLTSSPAITTKYSDQREDSEEAVRRVRRKRKSRSSEDRGRRHHRHRLKQEISISSPDSQRYQCRLRSCDCSSEEDRSRSLGGMLPCEAICLDNTCSSCGPPRNCCCNADYNHPVRMHFDDDYISLKIDGINGGSLETDAIISEEALRRARRKRRRRRKRRMKRALAMGTYDPEAAAAVRLHDRRFKMLHSEEEELPQPARWTIIATACLLLFMCLLLVAITLRMAPIIDDMVRQENEELLSSLNKDYNETASVRNLT